MEHMAKSVLRQAKNVTKGYSEVQVKVREATSNDPWGPSGSIMAEISEYTYNHQNLLEIMEIVSKRLNDHGKNWRHVFKSLILLDYLVHSGSENVINYAKDNLYIIKTLKEFQYIDEEGKDQGINIRQKSKDLTNLLQDDNRLASEREQRKSMKNRMGGGYASGSGSGPNNYDNYDTAIDHYAPRTADQEQRDLERAIEESKRSAKEHEERYGSKQTSRPAIEESKPSAKPQIQPPPAQQQQMPDLLQIDSPQTPNFDPFATNPPVGNNGSFQQQQQQQNQFFDPFQSQQQNQASSFDPFSGNGNNNVNVNINRVPFQVQQQMRNDANNNLANVARNAPIIDPFASITATNSGGPLNQNFFQPQQQQPQHQQLDLFAGNPFGGSVLVPQNNNNLGGSNQTKQSLDPFADLGNLGSVNKSANGSFNSATGANPFAAVNSNGGQPNPNANKTLGQLSMEKMAAGFATPPSNYTNVGVNNSNFVHPFAQPLPNRNGTATPPPSFPAKQVPFGGQSFAPQQANPFAPQPTMTMQQQQQQQQQAFFQQNPISNQMANPNRPNPNNNNPFF